MAVADRSKSIIVEQLGVDEEVTPDASFVDDLAPTRSTRWARHGVRRVRDRDRTRTPKIPA
jgi:hypothetical protein